MTYRKIRHHPLWFYKLLNISLMPHHKSHHSSDTLHKISSKYRPGVACEMTKQLLKSSLQQAVACWPFATSPSPHSERQRPQTLSFRQGSEDAQFTIIRSNISSISQNHRAQITSAHLHAWATGLTYWWLPQRCPAGLLAWPRLSGAQLGAPRRPTVPPRQTRTAPSHPSGFTESAAPKSLGFQPISDLL